jgi:hypothetical protein
MATKLGEFLQTKKIDPRRVITASARIERLRPEDRAIRLKQRLAKKSEEGKRDASLPKPRSGRPVTTQTLEAALAGKPLSGAARTRILRAVNHVLEQKKQDQVDLRALFELPAKGGSAKSEGEAAES